MNQSRLKNRQIAGATGRPIVILLAEDDEDDQLFYREALAANKIETTLIIVKNGKLLLENLKDPSISLPDIIFLDLHLPIIDGLDCMKEIRKDSNLKEIPSIFFSTSSDAYTIERAYEAGANLFFSKSTDFIVWMETMDKILHLNWEKYFPPSHSSFFIVNTAA